MCLTLQKVLDVGYRAEAFHSLTEIVPVTVKMRSQRNIFFKTRKIEKKKFSFCLLRCGNVSR